MKNILKKFHGLAATMVNKKLMFLFIGLGAVWFLYSVKFSQYDFSVMFAPSEDDFLIQELEKFDFKAENHSCHMRLTSKRLNNLFNMLSEKEDVFEYQLDKLKALSFKFPSESRKITKELHQYVNMDNPKNVKVNSKFLKMLYDKSLYYSFDRNREFALIEPQRVSSVL